MHIQVIDLVISSNEVTQIFTVSAIVWEMGISWVYINSIPDRWHGNWFGQGSLGLSIRGPNLTNGLNLSMVAEEK